MSFQGHFIGYGDLEKLIAATHDCGTIFSNCIVESSPTQMGMENCSSVIQVARIEGEIVHYWRWKIATVLMFAPGQAMDEEKDRRVRNASESAWPIILKWLGEKGTVIEASISMPRDLKYLEGQRPSFLDYEKETSLYRLREENHA